jgi:hypothetical protein
MARFINKNDLVELLEDEENCVQFLCDKGLLILRNCAVKVIRQ